MEPSMYPREYKAASRNKTAVIEDFVEAKVVDEEVVAT